ncbi:Oidioi.mRNA.OKI2018_I69.XSR.g15654.t1.cds [Oikopleura dioica]|uniref:Oidioi.mRNA.OKI2018_I69.XSR.g15654.t1.cds n=1 Tax=Oikopleura dioica TaxID=34765 RepID=A0ABN7SHJ2_OIKDI|nr:Oidioi.mRNA.OKI2018_I69.XSR.g15654.t1.cds [Oikopleura dioica]
MRLTSVLALLSTSDAMQFDFEELKAFFHDSLGIDAGDYFEENAQIGTQLTSANSGCNTENLQKKGTLECKNYDLAADGFVDHNTVCNWKCLEEGKILKSKGQLTCVDGQWEGTRSPNCVEPCAWRALKLATSAEWKTCKEDDSFGMPSYVCQPFETRRARARCSCRDSRKSGKCEWKVKQA